MRVAVRGERLWMLDLGRVARAHDRTMPRWRVQLQGEAGSHGNRRRHGTCRQRAARPVGGAAQVLAQPLLLAQQRQRARMDPLAFERHCFVGAATAQDATSSSRKVFENAGWVS